jgi:hypothetical protein
VGCTSGEEKEQPTEATYQGNHEERMKIIQLLPDTSGWLAVYKQRDLEEPVFSPIIGWALLENSEIIAMVPSTDGHAIPCDEMRGQDGELTFDTLMCACEHDGSETE